MSFGYGPPIPVKPSFELKAEYLLRNKQYQAAYQEYIVNLKRQPNRYLSMQDLSRTKSLLLQNHMTVPEGSKPYFNCLMRPEFFH